MIDRLEALSEEAQRAIKDASDLESLQAVRATYLGKKGSLTSVLKGLRDATPDERREIGQASNRIKVELSAALDLQQGRTDAALAKLEAIVALAETSPELRQRAARLVDILKS